MKKIYKYLFSLVMLSSFSVFSQVYISPNSYVYVKDQLVYVRQGINLQSNGNIFLRREGQLLQGTTGASTNLGLGKLSVFQEGTSDNFDYNYWCSPIGNASALSGNENFGITMLEQPVNLMTSTPATILPYSSWNGTANPLSISSHWVWKYITSNVYDPGGLGWIYVGGTTSVAAGQGFTMKGTSTAIADGGPDTTTVDGVQNNSGGTGAQRYDFRGKPNDGNISVNVGLNMLTLTGNPYPSALHVNGFLLDAGNTACDGNAYYWEQNKSVNSHYLAAYQGGYGTYSPISLVSTGIYVPATYDTYNPDGTLNTAGGSSGLSIERKYAPIGQGFMIKGSAGGTVTLRNSHRVYYKESGSLSEFERAMNHPDRVIISNSPDFDPNGEVVPVSQIRLNTTFNNSSTCQMALAFVLEATDGIDRGIDAKTPNSETLPNDVYFFLNNDRYIIQGVQFDIDKRIPIGVKSTENTIFKFDASLIANFDASQNIYMYDALDSTYHDIKNDTYEVTMPAGVFNNRFEITFKDSALSNGGVVKDSFFINQNNSAQVLTINNPNVVELKSVALFDLTGKQIFKEQKLGAKTSYQFNTNSISDAVYIVRIITSDNKEIAQKIIVSNTTN